MPKATCTLVGIISLQVEHVEPGSPISKTDFLRTDDQHLSDTLARLVAKPSAAARRERSMSRLSEAEKGSPMPQQTIMVRANVERLEAQLYEQAEVAMAEIETAQV